VAEPIVVADHVNTDADGPATLTVSASTGLARYPIDGTTLPELIRSADTRMYGAKAQRR
jgi:GGDEF domain-containing protein